MTHSKTVSDMAEVKVVGFGGWWSILGGCAAEDVVRKG